MIAFLSYFSAVVVGTLWATLRAKNASRDRGRLVGLPPDEWLGDDDPTWRIQT